MIPLLFFVRNLNNARGSSIGPNYIEHFISPEPDNQFGYLRSPTDVRRALAGEAVVSYVLHHEPFRSSIRELRVIHFLLQKIQSGEANPC